MELKVIYEDNHLLVVEKIPNVLSQADNTNDVDMLSLCKEYIKEKYQKPGNVFIGLVHRLDRPVGGVMVFARTSKAASRLSDQVRTKTMKKTYQAVVKGKCEKHGDYVDYLIKDSKKNMVSVVDKNKSGAKYAHLSYSTLDTKSLRGDAGEYSLLEIYLDTGRPHQIRVQFASRNHALYADHRYSKNAKQGEQIALWATKLEFIHPISKEKMIFKSDIPNKYPWSEFRSI